MRVEEVSRGKVVERRVASIGNGFFWGMGKVVEIIAWQKSGWVTTGEWLI
jgi:hypothetical protein